MQEAIPATSMNGTVNMYNTMVGQLNNLQFSQADMAGLSGSQDFVQHGHYIYSQSPSQPPSSPQHHMTSAQQGGGGSPQHCSPISPTQPVSSPTHPSMHSTGQFPNPTDPHLAAQLSPQHSNNNIPDIILTGG